MTVVGQNFRPEFINRVDDIVVFHPLKQKHIRLIAGIQINKVKKRLLARDLHLQISDEALDFLGNVGFDPVYGARPLKRAIQDELENPLASKLLAGDFTPGSVIQVNLVDHQLEFVAQKPH